MKAIAPALRTTTVRNGTGGGRASKRFSVCVCVSDGAHFVHYAAVTTVYLAVVHKDTTKPLLQRAPDHPVLAHDLASPAV